MPIFYWVIPISWLVFLVVWAFSALGVKKDRKPIVMKWWALRAIVAAGVIFFVIFRSEDVNRLLARRGFFPGYFVIVGACLCVLGIAFAIWARWHLGKNWSASPTIKEGHELVVTGPYQFVRHPIYTGILTAVFGSTMAAGPLFLVIFIVFCFVFVRRISVEENLMVQLFPETYPQYKSRTKALIPFVW